MHDGTGAGDLTAQCRHNMVVSADPAAVTPQILNGTVLAIATTRNTVVLGGSFTRVRNPGGGKVLKRTGLLAFHRASGRVVRNFRATAGRAGEFPLGRRWRHCVRRGSSTRSTVSVR